MKRKVVIALASGLFFYSLSDVLLWQRIFEAHDLFRFDAQYQNGHVITLIALIGVGVVMLWDVKLYALWYAGAFYTLAFGGVCDVLYYWIDHRAVPASMPWLNDNPFVLFKPAGGWGLVASSAIWVVVCLTVLWVAPMMREHFAKLWAIAPRRERFLTLLAALVVVVAFASLSPIWRGSSRPLEPQNPDATRFLILPVNPPPFLIPIDSLPGAVASGARR